MGESQGRGLAADARALEAILKSAVAAIVTTDQRGIIQTTNPALGRMLGYTESEVVGRNITMLMPESDGRRHDAYIARYMGGSKARIIGIGRELVAKAKDGRIVPIHLSIGEFEVGGEKFFTGIMIDLGAQRRAEAQLDQTEALFRSIFESLPDAIIITDGACTMRLLNPTVERLFGYAPLELIGRSTDLLHESIEAAESMRSALPTAEPHRQPVTVRFRRKDATLFSAETVRAAINDRSGQQLGFVMLVRDITEKLEQEAVLRQAMRMEAVGQLTGGIAHDFNNLLTVILGNVELLEDKLKSDLERALAREAREAAEMGARLTDRLLTFSRRQRLERRKVDLNELVLGMLDLLRRTLGEPIDLSTALQGELWLTEIDPVQIENAVLNLAINARDAMAQGGRIVIETHNTILDDQAVALIPGLAAGDYVQLSVSDTGAGMTPEVRERALEPFFTTKGPGKGSGLGLATIYGFARQSGGNVTIYSEVGKGTTVNIYLPRSTSGEAEERRPAHTEIEPGHGERILMVEDDERVRRLTRTRLEALGYVVSEAVSGVEALAYFEKGGTATLVFSDLVMPGGVSGLDLVRRLREIAPRTRALLTTGYAAELLDSDDVKALKLKILRKPYRQADLARMIREVIEGRGETG